MGGWAECPAVRTRERGPPSASAEIQFKNIKWKINQSTQINLIGCDTIVNSPRLWKKLPYLSSYVLFSTEAAKMKTTSTMIMMMQEVITILLLVSSKTILLAVSIQTKSNDPASEDKEKQWKCWYKHINCALLKFSRIIKTETFKLC